MGVVVLDETAIFGSAISLNFEESEAWRRFAEHYDGLVLRDRNHPSVLGWSFGNELFAIFDHNSVPNEIAEGWYRQLAELGARARRLDPTRDWVSCNGARAFNIADGVAPTESTPGTTLVMLRGANPSTLRPFNCSLTDRTATRKDSLCRGFYYSPFKGNDGKSVSLDFKRGEGIDQFGREQASGPETRGGPGVWEHRVIGLCGFAPGILPRHGIVFRGGKPGTYRVYIDNLQIRHADGGRTPIWTGVQDTRSRPVADTELFTSVRVRAVPVDQAR